MDVISYKVPVEVLATLTLYTDFSRGIHRGVLQNLFSMGELICFI